jgi:hypothetical protein
MLRTVSTARLERAALIAEAGAAFDVKHMCTRLLLLLLLLLLVLLL